KPSASSASTASTTSASAPLACSEPIPAAWLRRVWERLAAVYPSKWRAAMGESPQADDGKLTVYGDTWAKGLAGLSPEQLGRGLEACITRTDPWPPVLAQFRALCLGIPEFSEVRADMARDGAKRAPFTVLVGRSLDGYRFRMADAREADRLLREAYEAAREAVMRGELLPEPLAEIAQDTAKPAPASPEVARAHLAEI